MEKGGLLRYPSISKTVTVTVTAFCLDALMPSMHMVHGDDDTDEPSELNVMMTISRPHRTFKNEGNTMQSTKAMKESHGNERRESP